MTLPTRFAPLLMLALMLTACMSSVPKTAQPTSQQEPKLDTPAILGSAGVSVQHGANLTGGIQATATLEPIAPTVQPTTDIAPLLAEIDRLKQQAQRMADENLAAQKDIADKYEHAAADNKKTAQYNYATGRDDLLKQKEITLQKDADARIIAAQALLVDAQARLKEAEARLIMAMCLVVVVLIFYLLMKYALRRPHVNNIVTRRVTGEKAEPIAVSKTQDDYDTTPPGSLRQFAALMDRGIRGGAFGNGSVIDARIYNSDDYKPVREWFYKKEQRRTEGHEPSLFKPGPNNSRIFSVDGIAWAQAWLDWYDAQPPSPSADVAENTSDDGNGHAENGHVDPENTEGEMFDPHDILPKDGE